MLDPSEVGVCCICIVCYVPASSVSLSLSVMYHLTTRPLSPPTATATRQSMAYYEREVGDPGLFWAVDNFALHNALALPGAPILQAGYVHVYIFWSFLSPCKRVVVSWHESVIPLLLALSLLATGVVACGSNVYGFLLLGGTPTQSGNDFKTYLFNVLCALNPYENGVLLRLRNNVREYTTDGVHRLRRDEL